MSLASEIWELVRAGFSGIWVETHEPSEAILELSTLGREHGLQIVAWNLDAGMRTIAGDVVANEAADPLSAVRALGAIPGDQSMVLLLENFHRFIDSPEVCQAMLTQLMLGKQQGRHVVVLSPLVKLPVELERQFVVINHPLPDREQLWEIAETLVDDPDVYPSAHREMLLDAAAGLTRMEAESAFSLSLVRHGRIIGDEIWELKSRWLQKSGMLRLHKSEHGFDSLGGLSSLKRFCENSLRRQRRRATERSTSWRDACWAYRAQGSPRLQRRWVRGDWSTSADAGCWATDGFATGPIGSQHPSGFENC